MSGGAFNYKQYEINDIIKSIQDELEIQGKPKPDINDAYRREFYEKYPEDKYYPILPKEIQREFKKGIKALKVAQVYAHRIDWFLSGDDGEDSFLERLDSDLKKLSNDYTKQ